MIETAAELQYERDFQNLISSVINDFRTFADSIIGLAMLMTLLIVVYHVINDVKYGKGKQAVVSWVIALTIWIIVRAVV